MQQIRDIYLIIDVRYRATVYMKYIKTD